jgi:hypothetical protein
VTREGLQLEERRNRSERSDSRVKEIYFEELESWVEGKVSENSMTVSSRFLRDSLRHRSKLKGMRGAIQVVEEGRCSQ